MQTRDEPLTQIAIDNVHDFTLPATQSSPAARRALRALEPGCLPRGGELALRGRFAELHGVELDGVALGNGSTELLHLLLRSLGAGNMVVVLAPALAEYERAAKLAGVLTVSLLASAETDFVWDISLVCQRLAQLRPAAVLLANPSGLTGSLLDEQSIEALAGAIPAGVLVLDETQMCFADRPPALRRARGNLLSIRSMSFEHGLAGLRLGYAIGPAHVVAAMQTQQPARAINAAAQVAAIASLDDPGWTDRSSARLRRHRSALARALARIGFCVLPSQAAYLLVETQEAAWLCAALAALGIKVTDGARLGVPGHIQIAVRGGEAARRLVDEMKRLLGGRTER
ncbi:aminotransferase class I/II-fold pyridoxal phosphate-dependent enzyme [Variovorax sp. J22P271]|uniref:aminotransferase class I/II-fold pyridoxal phosphate-dependent enzyme n=1 Tax=Variovorax davisae TaxID=3053515 RepID=UPI0025760BC9|nr:aminotransferase class I/II-fold pyridoxal phosphate-dependent enzyme [Variovorax sp. J22P271]MDM0032388.1 aminotransferase class I/II-fold pyridoxal phosphate-dependent enzyme [Variovorax sp. J22P271]